METPTISYVLMKTLSSFIKKNKKIKMEACPYCIQKFSTHEKLDNHKIDHNKEKLEFANYQNQIKNPFVIYCDFESTLANIDTCELDLSEPFSNQIQKYTPNSLALCTY